MEQNELLVINKLVLNKKHFSYVEIRRFKRTILRFSESNHIAISLLTHFSI